MPRVREHGLLRQVAFAVVNPDQDGRVGQSAHRRRADPPVGHVPQDLEGLGAQKLVGGQSVETVEQFINEGLASDKAEKKAEKKTEPEDKSSNPDSSVAPSKNGTT